MFYKKMETKMVTYIYFWGHKQYGQTLGKECLSQWYDRPFTHEGVTFPTCEHWMMYQKALLFKDTKTAETILTAQTPNEVKKLGRQVANFIANRWDEHKYEIVKAGNFLKFTQHKDLAAYLCQNPAGDIQFVEASPYDTIWGIGLKANDSRAKDPSKWLGQNLLGKALTDVRHELLANNSVNEPMSTRYPAFLSKL